MVSLGNDQGDGTRLRRLGMTNQLTRQLDGTATAEDVSNTAVSTFSYDIKLVGVGDNGMDNARVSCFFSDRWSPTAISKG